MNLLGYYFLFAALVILSVVGFEIRRFLKKRRLNTPLHEASGESDEASMDPVELAEHALPSPVHPVKTVKPGQYSLSWHHISPEIKKGHVLRVHGHTNVDCPYELLIEPRVDLSLQILAFGHGQSEARATAGEPSLLCLYPGMHAALQQDEDGRSHLVSGPSGLFKQDSFWQDRNALLVIENHAPRRQTSELRVYYKFEEPTVTFVELVPAI